ncbi:hypothetical protein D3C75_990510 [compost metagenome]
MGDPLTQQAISWCVVIDQQRIDTGLTEHQLFFRLPVILNPQRAVLVFVQFIDHALTQMETHQAADIAGAEPWLVFQEESMEREVVAGEDCYRKEIRHGRSPWFGE